MAKDDYYDILGVSKNATNQEIKSAYRRLALKWHPDRNKSKEAASRFKKINEAYEVLSNKEKRAAYDQFGHAAFQQGFPGTGPFAGQTRTYRQGPFTYTYTTYGSPGGGVTSAWEDFGFGGFTDPFEIFEQFFGSSSPFGVHRRPRKPVYSLKLDFMEAVKGCQKEITVEGKTKKIKIPAGIDNGSKIRFDDFDLIVNVRPHDTFRRDGYDIFVDHTISFPQAVLGTVARVSTIDGPVDLRIKPGVQPGALIRLRKKGVPFVRGHGRGDQYIRIKVDIPKKISRRAKELLAMLEKEISS